ncbi:MAG: hypothetical protein IID31_01255 [Planctomycetes bacterium]|nr:hypothetical protein [Planctomycetota bacterium]
MPTISPEQGILAVPEQIEIDFNEIHRKTKYPQEAFAFVQQGLAHTVKLFQRVEEAEIIETGESSGEHHVNGRQLCEGLRDLALNRYGLLARTVLSRWGVHATDDFGRIVFAMIDAGLMRKSDEDRLEDFASVYEFDKAFPKADSDN